MKKSYLPQNHDQETAATVRNTTTMKYSYNERCGNSDNTDSSIIECKEEVDSDPSIIIPTNIYMMMNSPINQQLTKKIHAKDLPHYWKKSVRDQKQVYMYMDMDPITAPFPVETIHSLVNITAENRRHVKCQYKTGVKKYDIFNGKVRKLLPAQMSPPYRNIKRNQVPHGDRKSRRG